MTAISMRLGAAVLCILSISASASDETPSSVSVGDDRLAAVLDGSTGELRETGFVIAGQPLPGLAATAWAARVNGKSYRPACPRIAPSTQPAGRELAVFTGEANSFRRSIRYARTGAGRITRTLMITAAEDIRIEEVALWQSAGASPPIVARTPLQGIAAFYRLWTGFVGKHFDLWKKTWQLGEDPGVGSVEIYSHAAGSRGLVFLVNPQYWSRTARVPLDDTLGSAARGGANTLVVQIGY